MSLPIWKRFALESLYAPFDDGILSQLEDEAEGFEKSLFSKVRMPERE